jgi:hypothetical protein
VIRAQTSTGFILIRWNGVQAAVAAPRQPNASYVLEGKPASSLGRRWTLVYKGAGNCGILADIVKIDHKYKKNIKESETEMRCES